MFFVFFVRAIVTMRKIDEITGTYKFMQYLHLNIRGVRGRGEQTQTGVPNCYLIVFVSFTYIAFFIKAYLLLNYSTQIFNEM